MNHVKENDLAHGQFGKWLEKIGLNQPEANRMMKVAKELPNFETLRNLGTTALYLIATLPKEEKQAQLERVEQGDRTFGHSFAKRRVKFLSSLFNT